MNYVCLNLRGMLKNHPGIFLLIMLSEIAVAICILFSYGLIMKMQDENSGLDDDMFYYHFKLKSDTKIGEKAQRFIEILNGDLDSILFDMSVTDKNGMERECGTGSGVDLKPNSCILNEAGKGLIENGKVMICGKEFEVAEIDKDGRQSFDGGMWCDFWVPLSSVPDTAVGKRIEFEIKSRPTVEKVDFITQAVMECFNAEVSSTPKPIDLMKQQQNNTFYAYAFVIVMIAVMNLAMYFRYIVGLRKKQIRILTVCGATPDKVKNIFLIENLIELIAGYLIAFLVFRLGLFKLLLNYYPAFEDYYSGKVYLLTFAIFAVGSMLILMLLISPGIRKAAAAGKEF